MNLARVIGTVWATRKYPTLEGRRLLFAQPLTFGGDALGDPIVMLDTADAGVGDVVLYVTSSEAAIPFHPNLTPTDATIVGVVERIDRLDTTWHTLPGAGTDTGPE
ncbi:EutN/CcmL family microcompartment protein [Rhodocaloribacter litoris]|uniref:EutN/CcmL family microcompartment protein n=1 Tax=Rhodocaloribacter litoris TaxID=2558931 RepID=UPI00141DC142|nr:EutN/CcmL family microcompartment protein [Rhodocaloribacter litoris]QXD14655.1 EutN/CcmL family microcompartment protein [Rhodocaloribacter litoris]GIV59570.1 MAG: ethanolamine utilization protein EutN [Rhodothermaceae bacterium]